MFHYNPRDVWEPEDFCVAYAPSPWVAPGAYVPPVPALTHWGDWPGYAHYAPGMYFPTPAIVYDEYHPPSAHTQPTVEHSKPAAEAPAPKKKNGSGDRRRICAQARETFYDCVSEESASSPRVAVMRAFKTKGQLRRYMRDLKLKERRRLQAEEKAALDHAQNMQQNNQDLVI